MTEKCPECKSENTSAHIQTIVRDPVVAVHSVGWRCLDCQHIWGHEGTAENVLGY